MMNNGIHRQSSLREKLKSSICCFTSSVHHDSLEHQGERIFNKLHIPRTPISPAGSYSGSSSSFWFKKSPTGASEFGTTHSTTPRGRSRGIRHRIGRRHHRQSLSADFSYDPSSYALNFENEEGHEELPIRNFSSRLPASPPSSPPANYSEELPKEIVGYS